MTEQTERTMEPWSEDELRTKVGQVSSLSLVEFSNSLLCMPVSFVAFCLDASRPVVTCGPLGVEVYASILFRDENRPLDEIQNSLYFGFFFDSLTVISFSSSAFMAMKQARTLRH